MISLMNSDWCKRLPWYLGSIKHFSKRLFNILASSFTRSTIYLGIQLTLMDEVFMKKPNYYEIIFGKPLSN